MKKFHHFFFFFFEYGGQRFEERSLGEALSLERERERELLTSRVLKDLSMFVEFHDEISFAKIPCMNRSSLGNLIPSGHKLDHSHVPKWLPGFLEGNWEDKRWQGKEKRERERERERGEVVGGIVDSGG
jgi:hypothetical protein